MHYIDTVYPPCRLLIASLESQRVIAPLPVEALLSSLPFQFSHALLPRSKDLYQPGKVNLNPLKKKKKTTTNRLYP